MINRTPAEKNPRSEPFLCEIGYSDVAERAKASGHERDMRPHGRVSVAIY